MWYKRYGYKQPANMGSGIGLFSILAITLVSLALTFTVAAYFESFLVLLLFFPLSIGGYEIADRIYQKQGNKIKEKRLKKHLEAARKYIEQGKTTEARSALQKAKIYGDIPEEYLKYQE